MALEESLQTRISQLLDDNRVVLFMKGTRSFPQCGFSATVVQILDDLVPQQYETVNVLKDPDLREGVKQFANWPTIPQLYVNGKFVGGCDIVREMYVSGELHGLLGVQAPSAAPPAVRLTDAARKAVLEAGQGQEGALRLGISSRFEYELSLDEPRKGDFEIDVGGVKLLIDAMSAKRADGISIDYANDSGGGFRIDNPNEPARVRPLAPAELKAMLERGEPVKLIDVRSEQEYGIARIAGGTLLDNEVEHQLEALDRGTTLVFYCHHGMRSGAAAERFAGEGWKRVFNLEGGIDAWSREIDPNVPRY